jgi:hypothetical protein
MTWFSLTCLYYSCWDDTDEDGAYISKRMLRVGRRMIPEIVQM